MDDGDVTPQGRHTAPVPEVDFVVGPAAAGEPVEDELTTGPDRPSNRLRSYALAAVVIAALAVVGVVRLTGHSGRPPAAAISRVPSLPHPVAVPIVLGGPRRPVADLSSDPRSCPEAGDGSPICSASHRLPRPVKAALVSRFPDATAVRGLDEEVRDTGSGPGGLWFREVRARIGDASVTITVTHHPVTTPEEVDKLPSVVTFDYARHGLFVHTVVRLTGKGTISVPKLIQLTSDRRLRQAAH